MTVAICLNKNNDYVFKRGGVTDEECTKIRKMR